MFFLASGERLERLCHMVNIIENTTENRRINTNRKNDIYIVNFTRESRNNKSMKTTKALKLTKVNFHCLLEGTVITL
nr:MAG TPA: hypothetical protein [Caudoviricetes sp.]